jgi:hypothetical protein
MAGTLAQWLKDHPDALEDEEDAESLGMYTIATGFLRMYHELLALKAIEVPTTRQ